MRRITVAVICGVALVLNWSWAAAAGNNRPVATLGRAAVAPFWDPNGNIELSDKVVVGTNHDGRLEIVFRNNLGSVYHEWQTGGGWASAFLNGVIQGDPAVINNQDGRLEVFGRGGDNAIWHAWQTSPDGGWHDGWIPLGCGQSGSDPAVGRNADGRLEVFYCGFDGLIYHTAQTVANGGWSGACDPLPGCCFVGNPAVGSNPDGRLEVFALRADGTIFHQWQTDLADDWNGVWFPLPGAAFAGNIVVGNNADGRLEVFSRSVNNCIFHAWQQPQGGWHDWTILCAPVLGDAAVINTADNRLGAFMHADVTNFILQASQNAPNGDWTGCSPLGDGRIASTPAVGRNADGRLELFIYQYDNNGIPVLRHSWQFWANGPWSGWADM
jgi:hypothetical protein